MFNFFKKNIIFFIIFLFIFSILLYYWKYPFTQQKNNLDLSKYEKIITQIHINKPEGLIEAENFIIKNHNINGTLMALHLAKKYVLQNNFNKAFIQLNNSLKYTKEEILKNVLKLRMAKIKIQQCENQEAINILNSIKNHNWDNIIENMKGDILIKNNKKKEAIESWKKSLFIEDSNASKEIINMKINEIK